MTYDEIAKMLETDIDQLGATLKTNHGLMEVLPSKPLCAYCKAQMSSTKKCACRLVNYCGKECQARYVLYNRRATLAMRV